MEHIPLTERKYVTTFTFVTSLFLLWGIAISMGDVLNRHFQKVLGVTLSQSGLVQFSIFGAYFVMGIPAGIFMNRYGYKNGVLFGPCLYAIGAFLFIPAAGAESFGFFRIALFVLACGLATLETVAHPFSAALGDERRSEQRINFSQTFNAIGAIIGPLLGGFFILSEVNTGHTQTDLVSVKILYAAIGTIVLAIAGAFWFDKKYRRFMNAFQPLVRTDHIASCSSTAISGGLSQRNSSTLRRRVEPGHSLSTTPLVTCPV